MSTAGGPSPGPVPHRADACKQGQELCPVLLDRACVRVWPVFLGKLGYGVPCGERGPPEPETSDIWVERAASKSIRTGGEIKMGAVLQNGCRVWVCPVGKGMTHGRASLLRETTLGSVSRSCGGGRLGTYMHVYIHSFIPQAPS